MQKNGIGPHHTPYIKTNSKWIKNFNVRPQTIKFLKESVGNKLRDTGFGNDFFLDLTPNQRQQKQETKTRILNQNKFMLSKRNNQKNKRTYVQ